MRIDNNFIVRSISGLILVVLLVGGVLYSPTSSFIILALIGIAGQSELLHNVKRSLNIDLLSIFTLIFSLVISILLFVQADTTTTIAILAALVTLRLSIEIFRKQQRPIESIAYEFFAIIYALIPMLLLTQIENREYIIALFLMVWSNDVGAYMFGVTFGKHKLCERLSPKKSWEGYVGGVVASVAVSLIAAYYFGCSYFEWGAFGVLISNCAVVGDLFESMIKRSIGIKDSGKLIPGHGGVLDRFDALLFAAPMYYIIYIFVLQ